MLAPPRPPTPEQLDALIREARARQRRRWLGAAAAIAVLAGAALAVDSLVRGGGPSTSPMGGPTMAVRTGSACGVRVAWTKILARDGRVLYHEPVRRTMGHQLKCTGSSIWVVFYNGVASNQEAYFGVHSGDAGRTWRPVFTERFFGLNAPHELDAYMGPWTLTGSEAYFVGYCPACGRQPTVSLSVTNDGGRTFRRYDIAQLDGYSPKAMRAAGSTVTISADRLGRRRTARVHVS